MMNEILAYWHKISAREKQGLIAVAVLLVVLMLYSFVVSPFVTRFAQAEKSLQEESELLHWVDGKIARLKMLQANSSNSRSQTPQLPLNQAVTTSVRRFNLEIIRLQPQRQELQVWLKPMPFSVLLEWLDDLAQNYGVEVKFIELGKTDVQGVVEVKRLQLG